MHKYVVVYNLNGFGGAENLVLRICEWCYKYSILFEIWTDGIENKELVNTINAYGIIINLYSSEKQLKSLLVNSSAKCEVSIINFTFITFMMLERNNNKTTYPYHNYLYVIHPNILIKAQSIHFKYVRNFIINKYKSYIIRLLNDQRIIFMDEVTMNHTYKYYSLNVKNSVIRRLPMFIEEGEAINNISNTVLLVSRAEFPFKQYVLWMIDNFYKLKDFDTSIKMAIISDGDDYDKIIEHYNKLAEHLKCDITLHRWLSHDELINEIKKYKVVVAMGTTVLEAANSYIPTIIACSYVNDGSAEGIFGSNCKSIGDMHGEYNIIQLLIQIFKAKSTDYINLCNDSHKTLTENYSFDCFFQPFSAAFDYPSDKSKCRLVLIMDKIILLANTLKFFL